MQTTEQEKDQLRDIIGKLVEGDKAWFNTQDILVGDKGQYWILNYRQGPRNEYNRLVRGMVVQKPQAGFAGDKLSLIRSFPFIRFYNHGEKDASTVNFSDADMMEKLDGTMVGVFFPTGDPNKPEFHTRKMISTHDEDMKRVMTTFTGKDVVFMPIIKKYVDALKFTAADVTYTYVFEFVHEVSQVLTKYKKDRWGLHLLAGRDVRTHQELTEKECDQRAIQIQSFRTRTFDAIADHGEIQQMFTVMAKETPDFEGYIFRDRKTGARVKVKDPEYVRKHHLLDGTSYKNLIPLILKGEEDEILAYYPHVQERIDQIKDAYSKYLNKVVDKIHEWKAKGLLGHDLAVAMFGHQPLSKWEIRLKQMRGEAVPQTKRAEPDEFIANMIIKYTRLPADKTEAAIDKEMRQVALGQGTNEGSPKALIDLIGLHDEEDDNNRDVGEL
jgi:hypothetical protein